MPTFRNNNLFIHFCFYQVKTTCCLLVVVLQSSLSLTDLDNMVDKLKDGYYKDSLFDVIPSVNYESITVENDGVVTRYEISMYCSY